MIFRVPLHPNSSFILCILGTMWSECASTFSYHIFLLGEGSLILQHTTACSRGHTWKLRAAISCISATGCITPQKPVYFFGCLWHFFIINYVFVSLTHGFSSKDIPVACEDILYCTWWHHISALLMGKGKRVLCVPTCGCQTRGWGGGGIFPPGRPGFLAEQAWLRLVPSTGCPCAAAPEAANGLRRVWVAFGNKTFLFKTAVKEQRDSEWEAVLQDLYPQSPAPAPVKGWGRWVPRVEFLCSASSCRTPIWELTVVQFLSGISLPREVLEACYFPSVSFIPTP